MPTLEDILKIRPLIMLGMGNPMRGDDGIGHLLAESLESINEAGFQAHAVATAIENAMSWVRKASGGAVLLVDAVFDQSAEEGSWHFYPAEQLDSMCHSTHSIPLSMLISFWRQEIPGLQVYFLGVSIRNNAETAQLSPRLQQTLSSLCSLIRK
jgi:hydrogenase maturation protease